MKMSKLVLAATLILGLGVLVSCNQEPDVLRVETVAVPQVSEYTYYYELTFSSKTGGPVITANMKKTGGGLLYWTTDTGTNQNYTDYEVSATGSYERMAIVYDNQTGGRGIEPTTEDVAIQLTINKIGSKYYTSWTTGVDPDTNNPIVETVEVSITGNLTGGEFTIAGVPLAIRTDDIYNPSTDYYITGETRYHEYDIKFKRL